MGREIGALDTMNFKSRFKTICGVPNWVTYLCLIAAIPLVLSSCSMQEDSAPSNVGNQTYPTSAASFDEVNSQTGCDSKFIEQKKEDIFTSQYKDHWMTWTGKVFHAEPESVSLDMNGKGIHELQAVFADPRAGYDILLGSEIKVRFILRSQGGCLLPFNGEMAEIVK
jgi:hypothetical protein